MWITYRTKGKNGKCYRITKDLTVKDAKEYYKKHHKNNDNIIKVWLTHFATWHEYHHSTLKDLKKGIK